MQHLTGIHSRPTRILRAHRDPSEDRKTLSCVAGPGAVCHVCATRLELEAHYCGACGERVRPRVSRVGTILEGLYRLDEKLGEGNIASVYRARDLAAGREIAVKVLHDELVVDDVAVARFRREGKCLARLRSANTVTLLDHGETDDGAPYLAMELLRGDTLDARIRIHGAVPWRDVVGILRGMCHSLEEAHGHGIVHRRVGPASTHVGADGTVKLLDFGSARLRPEDSDDELAYAGRSVGLLDGLAPEQVRGLRCTAHADLFGVGVTGVALLTGKLAAATSGGQVAVPRDVPAELADILVRCLAADPCGRPISAAALGLALDKLVSAATPSRGTEPRRRAFPHTPAFELEHPRIAVAAPAPPPFARGSLTRLSSVLDVTEEHEAELAPRARRGWRLWAFGLAVCCAGLGAVAAGCV